MTGKTLLAWGQRLAGTRLKHVPLAHAEIVEVAPCQFRCRFAELPRPGRYNLVIGTCGEKGSSCKLRCGCHPVRVLG